MYFLFLLPDPPEPAGTTLTSDWGRKHHIRWKAETEITLALAENVYVNLPTPNLKKEKYIFLNGLNKGLCLAKIYLFALGLLVKQQNS
jgi:hypothetical protein